MNSLFKDLMPLEQVKQLLQDKFLLPEKRAEVIPLNDALGRFLAADVLAGMSLPGFNRSTVDGYAVQAKDVYGASESLPAYLQVVGEVQMGSCLDVKLTNGQAVAVPTGGALPAGADAVVMIEYTNESATDEVEIMRPVANGENVIFEDEDVRVGDVVFQAGTLLRPEHLGVLSGLGIREVQCQPLLKAVVFSTGDEVIAPNETITPGKIRDMNGPMLVAALKQDGCLASYGGILPDNLQEVLSALQEALTVNDLILISGGSSVGQRDVTAQAIDSLGPPGVLVHGIGIKPGKPTIIGQASEGTPILGLPGHPVSAQLVYQIVVRYLIHVLTTAKAPMPAATINAELGRSLKAPSGRTEFIRVTLREEGTRLIAQPILGESGLLTTLAAAEGLVQIPVNVRGLQQGEIVEVMTFA